MEEFLIQLNLEVMNDFNTHHHLICRMLCLNFKEVRLFQSIQCLIPGNVDVFSKVALKNWILAKGHILPPEGYRLKPALETC